MKTVLSLYLVLAVILAQFFTAYFFSKGRTSYRKAFSALVLCISVYLFGYLMIINSNNLQEMVFWNLIQYLGLPFISVLWLMVALLYTKTIYSLKIRIALLLLSLPVITFFIRLTNSWHHLFYTKWEIRQLSGYYSLYMERGFWYYVNISYSLLCLLLTVIIYFIGYLKNKAGYTKPHFLVFLFASLLPFIGIVLILFAFEEWSIDYSALIIPISLLIISYGILKYDFLEIRTLARETIFENNLAGMVVLGPGNKIIDYNKAAEKFFEEINISLNNYPLEHVLDREPKLLEIFESKDNHDISLVIDGEKRFFEIDAIPLGDPRDVNTRILKSIRDVTEERKIQEKLKQLATIDSLSGLFNRAEFMNLAKKEFAWAKSNNEELSVLIMDVDNFKVINDTYGHLQGDKVLVNISKALTLTFRKTDIIGRIGGDEFCVYLRNVPSSDFIVSKCQQLKVLIQELNRGINVTVSIGISLLGDEKSYDDLFQKADKALYDVKAKGGNQIQFYQ